MAARASNPQDKPAKDGKLPQVTHEPRAVWRGITTAQSSSDHPLAPVPASASPLVSGLESFGVLPPACLPQHVTRNSCQNQQISQSCTTPSLHYSSQRFLSVVLTSRLQKLSQSQSAERLLPAPSQPSHVPFNNRRTPAGNTKP